MQITVCKKILKTWLSQVTGAMNYSTAKVVIVDTVMSPCSLDAAVFREAE